MSSETDRSTRWFQLLLYGLTALYVLNLLVQTRGFEDPAAQRFPFLFGVFTLVCSVVLLTYVLAPENVDLPTVQRNSDKRIQSSLETEQTDSSWKMSHVVLLTVSFPFIIYVLGFAIGIPVWLFTFTYFLRRNLKESLAVAIGMFVLWWILFVNFLGVVFYEGILF